MTKATMIIVAGLLSVSAPAFAGGGKSDAAKVMRDALQAGQNASVPAKNYTGGWGNIAGPANSNGKKNVAAK